MREAYFTRLCRCTVFFSSIVKQLNSGYPSLFGEDDEEGVQKGKGSSEEGGTDESNGSDSPSSFASK